MVVGDRRLTYAELDGRANRLAHHLDGGRGRPRRPRRPAAGQRHRVPRGDAGLLQDPRRAGQRQLPLRARRASLPLPGRRAGRPGLPQPLRRARWPAPLAAMPERRAVARGADDVGPAGRPADDYEAALAALAGGPGTSRPVGRRPLLRLHRRHHGHAQGRAVAPRGHLLRRHGRRRPALARHHIIGPRRARRPGAAPGPHGPGHPTVHARRRPLAGLHHAVRRRQARHAPRRASSTRPRCGAWWTPRR